MRIYTESSEETLRARNLLTQWTGDGSLSQEQYQRLEHDTVSDLRITNIFLSLVLFFFTMIGVAAAVATSSPARRASPPSAVKTFVDLIRGTPYSFRGCSFGLGAGAAGSVGCTYHGVRPFHALNEWTTV